MSLTIEIPASARELLERAHANAVQRGVCRNAMTAGGTHCSTGHIYAAGGIDPMQATFNPTGGDERCVTMPMAYALIALAAAAHLIDERTATLRHNLVSEIGPFKPLSPERADYHLALRLAGNIMTWNDTRDLPQDVKVTTFERATHITQVEL